MLAPLLARELRGSSDDNSTSITLKSTSCLMYDAFHSSARCPQFSYDLFFLTLVSLSARTSCKRRLDVVVMREERPGGDWELGESCCSVADGRQLQCTRSSGLPVFESPTSWRVIGHLGVGACSMSRFPFLCTPFTFHRTHYTLKLALVLEVFLRSCLIKARLPFMDECVNCTSLSALCLNKGLPPVDCKCVRRDRRPKYSLLKLVKSLHKHCCVHRRVPT